MKTHLSEEQISAWVAGERTAGDRSREAEHHLRDCRDCAAEVSETENAMLLFRDSGHQAADYWQRQPSQSHRGLQWVPAATAVALAIVAAVTLYRPSTPEPPVTQEVFLKIPYVIPPAPYERTEVVHMNVPVAALIAAGFRMDVSAASSVSADVMVGQDGRPLAVGFPEDTQ